MNSNYNLSIGLDQPTDPPSYVLDWEGSIDEVAIYNGALSADEILDHYNSGLDGFGYCINYAVHNLNSDK